MNIQKIGFILWLFLMTNLIAFGKTNKEQVLDSLEKISEARPKAEAYLYFTKKYIEEEMLGIEIFAEKAINIAKKNNFYDIQIQAYLYLAEELRYRQMDKVIPYLEKAENLAQEHGFQKGLLDVWILKANYFVQIMQYGEALVYAQKSIELIQKYKFDHQNPYLILVNIATKKGEWRKSINYYKKIIQESKESNLSGLYSDMGNIFYKMKNYDSARYCYLSGVEIAKKYKQKRSLGFLSDNVGLSFYRQGQYLKALFWQKEGLKYRKIVDSNLDIIANLNNLGQTYLALKQYDSAYMVCSESYKRSLQFRDLYLSQEVCELLAQIHLKKNMPDSAFLYQKQAYNYLDSIQKIQQKQAINGAETISEVYRKNAENELLKIQNENLSKTIFLVLMLFLFLVLFFGYVFRQNRLRKKLLKELKEANRLKDELFALIAHDLRSPVISFQIVSQQLSYFLSKNKPEKLQEVIQNIDQSSKNLSSILDNLLNWALSQKNEIRLDIKEIDLGKVVEHLQESYSELAHFSGINLVFEPCPNLTFFTDETILKTILRNLLGNAIKYTPVGGTISLYAQIEGKKVCIWVKDTGKGMSKEQMAQIFDKNLKKSEKGIRGERGTGLGLALVYEFSRLLDANLQVESQIGQGTSFMLCLKK